MKNAITASLLILVLVPFVAWSDDIPARVTPTQVTTEVAHAAVRGGEVTAGREAFIDLRCSRCHGVKGDDRIRRDDCIPVGPTLSFNGSDRDRIAAAIVARTPLGDAWVEADESGMSKSTSKMTVRQLADIIEYLHAEK